MIKKIIPLLILGVSFSAQAQNINTQILPPFPNNPQASGRFYGKWPGLGFNSGTYVAPSPISLPWGVPPPNWPVFFRRWPGQIPRLATGEIIEPGTYPGPHYAIQAKTCWAIAPKLPPSEPPPGWNGIAIEEPTGQFWRIGAMMRPTEIVWTWQCAAWGDAIRRGNNSQ